MPNWRRSKSMNPSLAFKIGDDQPSLLGFESIQSMKPVLEIEGVPLAKSEIRDLLNQTEDLAMIKGKWIHVDHACLHALLDKMDEEVDADNGYMIQNGAWLTEMLNTLRNSSKIKKSQGSPIPPRGLAPLSKGRV